MFSATVRVTVSVSKTGPAFGVTLMTTSMLSVSSPVLVSVAVTVTLKVLVSSKFPPFGSAKLIAPVTESILNVAASGPLRVHVSPEAGPFWVTLPSTLPTNTVFSATSIVTVSVSKTGPSLLTFTVNKRESTVETPSSA